MLSALELSEIEDRSSGNPDVSVLIEEVRRLHKIQENVQDIVDRKMIASQNYWDEASLGRVSLRYGRGMSSKLQSEAKELQRAIKD